MCVAHRHVELVQALARGSRPAAAEMRQHLDELERSLAKEAKAPGRRLRDAFAGYRDADRAEVG